MGAAVRFGRTASYPAVSVKRRYYTPELANRSLPLVQRIADEVRQTARQISETWLRLDEVPGDDGLKKSIEELGERFSRLVSELSDLGIELKNPLSGLLDFRAQRHGVEVCLCWQLGEDAVEHWHDLASGFAGRRPMSEF